MASVRAGRGLLVVAATTAALSSIVRVAPALPGGQAASAPQAAAPAVAAPVGEKSKGPASQARPRPASPSKLEVAVVDPAGRPVEGAVVLATPVYGAWAGAQLRTEKVRSAVTDKSGRATLEHLPRAPWAVEAHARGFASAHRERVSDSAVELRLAKGLAVTGVIRDGATRAPVVGARVSVEEYRSLPEDWAQRAVAPAAVTDGRGLFRLDGLGARPATIVVRASGFGPARRESVRPGSRVEVYLFAGPTLRGSVRDESGKALPGATVRVFSEGWNSPPPPEATDARGRFAVAGIEAGEYWAIARSGSRAPAVAPVTIAARDETVLDLVVGDGGFVAGRVVDEAGRPLAGARLRPEVLDGRGLPAVVSESMAGESSANGSFALGPLPAGPIGIGVAHRGYAPVRVTATVRSRESTDVRDVTLESGLAIRGRVRGRDRVGLAGVLLRAEAEGAEPRATSDAETDADGAFEISGLPAATYAITAQAAGFAAGHAKAPAGGDPIEIVLSPGGSITGRVVDAAGEPLAGVSVQGEAEGDDAGERGSFWITTGDAGDGRFTTNDTTPGTYALRVRASGAGEASRTGVKVVAGRTTDVGTIALERGGVVTGTVIDADGQGIPGATVLALRDVHNRRRDDPKAETDAAGAFEIRGVRPGKVEVQVSHPAYVSGGASGVEVDPEKDPTPVRIVLVRGGRIEGRARHRDGRPFEDGRIMISSPGGAGPAGEPPPLLPDGSFVAEHVPAGRAQVYLLARVPSHPSVGGSAGLTTFAGAAISEVEVHEGETVSVELVTREVVVVGRVTRGGQALGGVNVSVTSDNAAVMAFMGQNPPAAVAPAGPPLITATSREDGAYELVALAPGASQVEMRGAGQGFPLRRVDLPDAERYELDLEVGEAGVTGVVVDKETGAPRAEAQLRLREANGEARQKGYATSAADGRFAIAVEAGDYVLEATARGRRPWSQPITTAADAAPEVRIEMEPGLEIRGRVLDPSGRPADVRVYAVEPEGGKILASAATLPDGSFRVGDLGTAPCVLVGGSGSLGFAMRGGIAPGGDPVTLALRPAGRVAVRLVSADGTPLKDAWPRVVGWDGVAFRDLPVGETNRADAPGRFELIAPAGDVVVAAASSKGLLGRATVRVAPNGTVALDVVAADVPH